jgi:hypothetical protein
VQAVTNIPEAIIITAMTSENPFFFITTLPKNKLRLTPAGFYINAHTGIFILMKVNPRRDWNAFAPKGS